MPESKISELGTIGEDGRLRLQMERVDAYLAEHKGERCMVIFQAFAPHTTKLQQAYYRGYILPAIRAARWKLGTRASLTQTDAYLKTQCPVTCDNYYQGVADLTQSEMSEFIEWIKQFAAENLNTFIEEPKAL